VAVNTLTRSVVKSPLLLDISRLIWRARRRGPTGIDRVELAYALHFLTGETDRQVLAVLHVGGFLIAPSPRGARRFVQHLAKRWEGAEPASGRSRWRAIVRTYAHLLCCAWRFGPWLRQRLGRYDGAPIFLVVSHHHVGRDHTIARIRRKLGAKTACFIHDLIPIEYPEYFQPGWEARYRRLASNVGRLFDAAIANSDSTARALKNCLQSEAAQPPTQIRIRTVPLGVESKRPRPTVECSAADHRYFVVLGTIEPRKNHLLLLNLWTRLASAMARPPGLLVIGARGWENEQVIDMLERSRRLRGLVEEHNGLSDAEVENLLCGARALLLPSFAEGFGLPLAEALAAGTPVICSDIPVFRELGREVPEYLDPFDLNAWSAAVLDYSPRESSRRAAQLERLACWRAPRWSEHFAAVEQVLGGLDGERQVTDTAAAARAV